MRTNSFDRRMARASKRDGKMTHNSEVRLDKMRELRMAGAILGNRVPYRSGMSMGFDFLHEDSFGPDDHFGTRDVIDRNSGPGDYIVAGIE